MHNKNVIFSCSHIAKKFELLEVLKDVSFTISKNEKVGLIGPNGCGKSTLLNIISNNLEKDSGDISYAKKFKIKYFPQVHNTCENLSGGEIAKKILAPIISSDADLFILDEPTNNLDENGLEMLENFVRKNGKAFLIVSHDRRFLDRTVTKIIEINNHTKSSKIYGGNYSYFVEQKAADIENQWKEYNDKLDKKEKIEENIKQKDSWLHKIESQTFHNQEKDAHFRNPSGKAAKRLKITKDKLEKFLDKNSEIERPKEKPLPRIELLPERSGTKVFKVKNLTKHIGKINIGPLNFEIRYGDRIHIVGANGTGKTTLIKMLLGEIKNDSGIIEIGENIKMGYVPQERCLLRSNLKVIELFLKETKLEEGRARKILNRFGISTEDVYKNTSTLSPGEYSRMIIAKLVALNPNCIILDEPSNHLDLDVLSVLENGLSDYTGTLIVISHDRYFVDKIKTSTKIKL